MNGAAAPRTLWLRTGLGLLAGLVAAGFVVAYLGISQKDLLASLHGVGQQPLLLAAGGALVLMALQSLR